MRIGYPKGYPGIILIIPVDIPVDIHHIQNPCGYPWYPKSIWISIWISTRISIDIHIHGFISIGILNSGYHGYPYGYQKCQNPRCLCRWQVSGCEFMLRVTEDGRWPESTVDQRAAAVCRAVTEGLARLPAWGAWNGTSVESMMSTN